MLSELVSLKKCCQCFSGRFGWILLPLQEEWLCSRYIVRHKGEDSWSFLFSSTAVPVNMAYIHIHNCSLPLSPPLKFPGCGWVSARRVRMALLWAMVNGLDDSPRWHLNVFFSQGSGLIFSKNTPEGMKPPWRIEKGWLEMRLPNAFWSPLRPPFEHSPPLSPFCLWEYELF